MTKTHHGRTDDVVTMAALLVLRAVLARGAPIAVLLPGGNSIVSVLHQLLEFAKADEWKGVMSLIHLFEVDAYQPTAERPVSNWDVLDQHLIRPALAAGLLQRQQLHPFVFSGDRAGDLSRYAAELDAIAGPPVIVCAAGAGEFPDGSEDPGHIAGLFPNFPGVWNGSDPFVCFSGAPKPPSERMTATPALFRKAGLVVALLLGSARRRTWEHYQSDRPAHEVPLKLIDEVPLAYLCTDVLMGG